MRQARKEETILDSTTAPAAVSPDNGAKRQGAPVSAPGSDVPFGVNEVRLNARQWVITLLILATLVCLTPVLWTKVERFDTGPDYRIPYQLSKDYWLYARRLRQADDSQKVTLLGDSVVWGEYVLPDGTLSHFLNQDAGRPDRFVNGGLNGLFPLAQEGLVSYYAKPLRHRKVILHCNVLWMTSPKADLSTEKEEQFNHSRLMPQFVPRIPCYRANANERLSAVVENHVGFIAWVGHLQNAYFGQKSILSWTLEEDGGNPPRYPNAYRSPLSQITLSVPAAPKEDPQRGPQSSRHRPWTAAGQGTTHFDWVAMDSSLQWHAFQRVIATLRARDNDVLVLMGPFNEHMIAEDNRAAYHQIRDGILAWLKQNQVPVAAPETLPSELYADASHPLTEGYKLLATRLYADEDFRAWLKR
jgi:hypothetical protein